jgi:ribonuclease H2 subunit A
MDVYKEALENFGANNGNDLTAFSNVPEICKKKVCYVGIDEAGRGPVLGPMVYGIFACVADEEVIAEKTKSGVSMGKIEENPPILLNVAKLNDSKQLTDKVREEIVDKVADLDYIVFGIKIIAPTQISSKSFRRQKVSLNEVSHDAAIELIQGLLDRGVRIAKVYVDTVGPMEKYQKKLEEIFPELKFKVDKKADSKYKPVSAASVFAKVARDSILANWKFPAGMEISIGSKGWGSGYPGDDVTKTFLRKNIDPIFGFPNVVRDSWSTAGLLLEKHASKVKWDDEEEEVPAAKITKFFSKSNGSDIKDAILTQPKSQFFSYRSLQQTTQL